MPIGTMAWKLGDRIGVPRLGQTGADGGRTPVHSGATVPPIECGTYLFEHCQPRVNSCRLTQLNIM